MTNENHSISVSLECIFAQIAICSSAIISYAIERLVVVLLLYRIQTLKRPL